MTRNATARRLRAEYVQWDCANEEEIAAFAGREYFGVTRDGTLMVRYEPTQQIQPVYPGWYVVRYLGDEYIRVYSSRAFQDAFELDAPS